MRFDFLFVNVILLIDTIWCKPEWSIRFNVFFKTLI